MKIALAQQNYHIGNFQENVKKIVAAIQRAKQEGVELIVFSELCVCGYPPRDFLEFDDFINQSNQAIDAIKEHADVIGVIIGAPSKNNNPLGKDLYNSAFLLYEKQVKGVVHKTLLPTYDIFDEGRYFEAADSWQLLQFKGKKLAITICEDIWNMGSNPLYKVTPMEMLIKLKPDILINISASPYNYAQDIVRNSIVKAHTLKYNLPMLYCNTVGSQTEIVFDGGSLVYDNAGNKVEELKYFEEDYRAFELEQLVNKTAASTKPTTVYYTAAEVGVGKNILDYLKDVTSISEIHRALVLGIKDYFGKMGFTKAIIGSSGGIDSAVTIALAVEALGAENVRAVLMPSQYSSGHSVSDAEQLSKNLGNPYEVIAIRNIYDLFVAELQPQFKNLPFSVAEENIQSRIRGNLLMAIANKFGYILLNTSNKSELATGYGTLYGDMAGGLGVLGDLYKTQVYALAKHINLQKEIIPSHIVTKPPSAELRPNQKDSDSLPEYDTLDTILFKYIEERQSPKALMAQGFDEALVMRVLKMVNLNEYKRNQFCPIIRVSYKAFGIGRRIPIVAKYLS